MTSADYYGKYYQDILPRSRHRGRPRTPGLGATTPTARRGPPDDRLLRESRELSAAAAAVRFGRLSAWQGELGNARLLDPAGRVVAANLPLRPLFDPDEGATRGNSTRNGRERGLKVTPTLNGLKYFEKPPLQYWATTALYAAFGVHDWTARLWASALAFLCIPLVFSSPGASAIPPTPPLIAVVCSRSTRTSRS